MKIQTFALFINRIEDGRFLSFCGYGDPTDPETMKVLDAEVWDELDQEAIQCWFQVSIQCQPWKVKH